MAMYKLLQNTMIRHPNGYAFPTVDGNEDYEIFKRWDALPGNDPDPADAAPLVYSGQISVDQRLRTTSATATEIWRATLAQLTLYRARLELLGVDAGNGNARYIQATVVAKRVGAGAVLVGAPSVVVNVQDAGASTWAITANVSGNDFVVTVTGQAGRTIDWRLSGSITSFAPEGA